MTAASNSAPRAKRIRLKPEVRAQLILEAALVEFSRHGFAATRLEDIARRAGLSKSGIYAHFPGKEAIFETLLTETLTSPQDTPPPMPPVSDPAVIRARVGAFVEDLYAKLSDPKVTAIVRLLIAESARDPELVRDWRRRVMIPHQERQRALMWSAIGDGRRRCSVIGEDFTLAVAPAVVVMLQSITFGDLAEDRERMKQLHKRMLLELLRLDEEKDADPPASTRARAGRTRRR